MGTFFSTEINDFCFENLIPKKRLLKNTPFKRIKKNTQRNLEQKICQI
jgi:hypothetical protein